MRQYLIIMAKKKVQVVIFYKSSDQKTKPLQVLVLKTSKRRGEFWQNVTGSVDHNEKFSQAAIREVLEETGLDINQKELFKLDVEYFFIDRRKRKVCEKVFTLITKQPQITISDEHTQYQWVSCENIKLDSYGYYSNYDAFTKALDFWKDK